MSIECGGPWFPPPEWKEGWEGLVTAYDYERRYVGCIGRETWDWLLASGITEAQVAALTQHRDEAEGLYAATANHLRASQAALATTRQALTEIATYGDASGRTSGEKDIARRALEATP